MSVYSSSSSLTTLSQECSSTSLQQLLKFILQTRPGNWAYSIFWRAFRDGNANHFLSWGTGSFQCSVMEENNERIEYQGSCNDGLSTDQLMDISVADIEWFYSMSLTKSFAVDSKDNIIVSRAFSQGEYVWLTGKQDIQFYNCERAKEAYMHGIQTFVCIPTSCGVVELGSLEIIPKDIEYAQQVKSLFGNVDLQLADHLGLEPDFSSKVEEIQQDVKVEADGGRFSSSESDGNVACLFPDRGQKKKVRKPVLIMREPRIDHVESERHRRERLNRRLCELRSVVPHVTKLDKASLLADAVHYIKELKAKNDELEKRVLVDSKISNRGKRKRPINHSISSSCVDKVEVKIVGSEAIIHVQCSDIDFPAANLMDALRDVDVQVRHASISTIKELVSLDVVGKISDVFTNEETIIAAISARMQN